MLNDHSIINLLENLNVLMNPETFYVTPFSH